MFFTNFSINCWVQQKNYVVLCVLVIAWNEAMSLCGEKNYHHLENSKDVRVFLPQRDIASFLAMTRTRRATKKYTSMLFVFPSILDVDFPINHATTAALLLFLIITSATERFKIQAAQDMILYAGINSISKPN